MIEINSNENPNKGSNRQPDRKLLRKVPFIGNKLANIFDGAPQVAVIRLSGVIGQGGGLRKGGLNLADLSESIEEAFELSKVKAVALVINSPGGSPVQSSLIAGLIRQLAEEKNIPVLAFCEDAAASGGYWLACAADEIYAQPASILGSIGVISAGFGFTDAIEKLGIERRVYTSGETKSQLDPFKPEKASDIKHIKSLQADIHEQFKNYVKSRRGERLDSDDKHMFSGSFWTGVKAQEMGLIDAIGDMRSVCRDKFGDKVKFKVMTQPKSWVQKKLGMMNMKSAIENIGPAAINSAEDRLWWNRLGL